MISFLSGGTGTPKLLRGVRQVTDDSGIAVVVNTAEDLWISGNHLSPDIDTVLYLFAGILDTRTWWGIEEDSFVTHDSAALLGVDEFIRIGDRDRAVHIARGELLRQGDRLTSATRALCDRFKIRATLLPMTDIPVETQIRTADGWIHFQDYWVRQRGLPPVSGIRRIPQSHPATSEVQRTLGMSDAVVIGPSNPVTSILPILGCEGVRETLSDRFVIAISPFIGDAPVSGPAGALMKAIGCEPSSLGTSRLYGDLVDLFIQDERDPVTVPGSVRLDTLMTDEVKSRVLAQNLMQIIRDEKG
ncbi:MAG: 2-phospho-L-lactate transferase [Methanoregulaceae archaeon]|nr:2-phospho-L-lactate transferase [Methanoregulaceae archaeon]